MENNNYPTWLVPLEIAKELKEIDFNEHCLFAFSTEKNDLYLIQKDKKDCVWYDDISLLYEPVVPPDSFLVPTWTDVLAWFRKKNLVGLVSYRYRDKNNKGFSFEILDEYADVFLYKTYEQAQEALVYKLIEIYKSEQE